MRFTVFALGSLLMAFLVTACVDPLALTIIETVDILVVDGTITNLPEPQVIRINRSKSDPLTGRSGSVPITKASVEVLVDSMQRIACHETVAGTYQLPSDFKGQVGHAYQLQFTLSDGTHYVSTQQVMQPVPAIGRVSATFNSASLPAGQQLTGNYRAGHDVSIDWTDPANQRNYYRWEWKLFERQKWCRSCQQGVYAVNAIQPHVYKDRTYYVSGNDPYESCFVPVNYNDVGQPPFYTGLYVYDYPCRTKCWDIIYSSSLDVFDDQYSNGGQILGRQVAHIPYYDSTAALVEIRQLSLPQSAHTFFSRFQNQTQNIQGLADAPPSAVVGNIQNTSNPRESIVGYFTASAVSAVRYWLDRKDVIGLPFGQTDPTGPSTLPGSELFFSLTLRQPNPEPVFPNVQLWGGPPRPTTAICVPSDSRTPFKPDGWQD